MQQVEVDITCKVGPAAGTSQLMFYCDLNIYLVGCRHCVQVVGGGCQDKMSMAVCPFAREQVNCTWSRFIVRSCSTTSHHVSGGTGTCCAQRGENSTSSHD